MKFRVSMKDSDTLIDAINECVNELKIEGISEDELDAVKEKRKEEYQELCNNWFEYGEYLTVEIDTEEKTCNIIKPE